MENDLKEEVSDMFKVLIRSLLSGGRDEFETDDDKVKSDVQDLLNVSVQSFKRAISHSMK